MTPLLVAAGVAAALGAAVAIGAQRPRTATLGVLVTLVLAPFVADPLPALVPIAFRIVAGVLAAFLLVIAARRADVADASPLGLPAALAAALAAFVAGLGATAVGLPAFGPAAALGAGLATIAVAVGPIALARNGFRVGVAAVVLLDGALLLRAALAGTPPALEALLSGLALVAVAAAATVLTNAAATVAGEPTGAAAVPLGPRSDPAARRVAGPARAPAGHRAVEASATDRQP